MTRKAFIDAVLEYLFVQGFDCPKVSRLADYVLVQWNEISTSPDPELFAKKCVQFPGVTHQPMQLAKTPSPTVGAHDTWLAVHEAGHAFSAAHAGLALWGVRFYGEDGFPGETGVNVIGWDSSTDEEWLRRLIVVDVAANIAEFITGVRQPEGGYPSRYFDRQKPVAGGQYPSDVINAWKRAWRLAVVQFDRERRTPDADAIWQARRVIVEEAEVEAERTLRDNQDALCRLAAQLQHGPMTGSSVRAMIAR